MTKTIFKYGDDITWSLPLSFQYDMVWATIYNTIKSYGIEVPKINAYGCPNCLWTGGRVAHLRHQLVESQLRKIFDYHITNNSIPTFTFTCTALTPEDFKDPYCNYLLDFGLEYGAHFIVFDDRLKNYIKDKNPNAYVVASVIKPTFRFQGVNKIEEPNAENESAYYNELLKEYDLVVVRPEYSKYVLKDNPGLIDDISRIEVLINQQCVYNCPISPEHYQWLEAARKHFNLEKNPKNAVLCLKNKLSHESLLKKTLPHTQETVKKLVKAGVKHLKLRGRSDSLTVSELTFLIYSQIFNIDGDWNLILFELGHHIQRDITFYHENIMRLDTYGVNINDYGRVQPFINR